MPSFGIKTVPVRVTYGELLRVWQEADSIPAIEHIWLWDHLVPLFGPADGDIHEGWTMLAALAARTERIAFGHLVTSNMTRPPALLAKMAATVDAIAPGRLVLGLGVGGTRQPGDVHVPREYNAYGLPVVSPGEGVARLDEACAIIKRLWTEVRFDFDGRYHRLRDAVCEPKPARRPPLLIGGWGDRTLGVVARHADLWNVPGPPHNSLEFIAERSKALDARCAEIGRDPAEIVRSTQIMVSYDEPAAARTEIRRLLDLGITHIVINLLPPFPDGAATWAAEEIIDQIAQ
ncbi:LLM class flavin-dependent oxidoreductase [Nonomuraea sp. SYSU D8015]|uniref:LLM class flavin-dependent oxidoreductase n=1 Tax=Nonomuraea sp. SYSU D8015 TaxID=2593644 RepID=UPI001660FBAA|nr:LLM class flavin-dependent oxidoreductase [Nonomuraea sp. SYSU D8015]